MRRFFNYGDWSFCMEVAGPSPQLTAGFWLDQEDGLVVYGRCPFWLSLRVTPPWSWRKGMDSHRDTSFTVAWDAEVGGNAFGLTVNVNRGDDWYSARETWPLWRRVLRGNGLRWRLDFLDLLFGRAVYEEETHLRDVVEVPMPEGKYPAVVYVKRVRWKRQRLPARWYWRNTIEVGKGGLPFPGKGENSWDCDDDATHSITFAVTVRREEPEVTAMKAAANAMETRLRRGGRRWVPSAGWAVHTDGGDS